MALSTLTSSYPQGMGSYNNRSNIGGYTTWKGSNVGSNPVAVTPGNIRPFTNKDYTNITPGPTPIAPSCAGRFSLVKRNFLPRPLKWAYRKGITTPSAPTIIENPEKAGEYITINNAFSTIINRESKTSKISSLIGQTIDRPGQFSVKPNVANAEYTPEDMLNGVSKIDANCNNCQGIGLVASFYPEPTYLSNNPEKVCTNAQGASSSPQTSYCCNQQRNALLRVRPASTNLKKNYYTTLQQYRQNRCQTYDQKIFNYMAPAIAGAPAESLANLYIANCYPNTGNNQSQIELVMAAYQYSLSQGLFGPTDISAFNAANITTIAEYIDFLKALSPPSNSAKALEIFGNYLSNPYIGMGFSGPSNPNGCKLVVYKPSNPQFATEGGVSSSARTLKLTLTTLEKNVYYNNQLQGSGNNINNVGGQPFVPFVYKNKVPKCSPNPYYPFMRKPVDNPKTCFRSSDDYLDKSVIDLGNLSGGPSVANNGISTSWSGYTPRTSAR
jgi:hypothetical protein